MDNLLDSHMWELVVKIRRIEKKKSAQKILRVSHHAIHDALSSNFAWRGDPSPNFLFTLYTIEHHHH